MRNQRRRLLPAAAVLVGAAALVGTLTGTAGAVTPDSDGSLRAGLTDLFSDEGDGDGDGGKGDFRNDKARKKFSRECTYRYNHTDTANRFGFCDAHGDDEDDKDIHPDNDHSDLGNDGFDEDDLED